MEGMEREKVKRRRGEGVLSERIQDDGYLVGLKRHPSISGIKYRARL